MKASLKFIEKHGKPAEARYKIAPDKQPRGKHHSKRECLELISSKYPELLVKHIGQKDFLVKADGSVIVKRIISWTALFNSLEV